MATATSGLGEDAAVVGERPVPFATEFVTITKQEHIRLTMEVSSWKTLHRKAVQREQWRHDRFRRMFRQQQKIGAQTVAALRAELELAKAQVRDLQQRVFGRKSERRKGGKEQRSAATVPGAPRVPRGQRRGARGHGRTMQRQLPERVEVVGLDEPQCPACGEPLLTFPGTEDSEVLEIDVKAYRRVIRRRRYRPGCRCGCVPGIVTAPAPARLIERGKFGVSVWATVLLDKFLYGRPSHRLLLDLADHGLNMSPGTLAGGLKVLAPLFEPLQQGLLARAAQPVALACRRDTLGGVHRPRGQGRSPLVPVGVSLALGDSLRA